MASTSSRRGMSHRALERQHTRADDPWCLVCGVNLALDGRTFSIVSGQQDSDLSDVLVRVLGMKFTDDNASVNVCNRCERHLKRIGRTANTASARNEGRQFREQAEKNMVKNFQAGVELGDYREPTFSSAPSANSSKTTREATATSAVKRGTTFDTNSSARNARDQYSRSSSVRFDDEKEVKKGAPNRDHSVPERVAQNRERDLMSSWDESKSKDGRRGTRTGAYSPSVERGLSVRANSIDQRTATEKRGQQRVSGVKETVRSITRTNTVDGSKKTSKVSQGQISSNNGESDKVTSHGDKKRPDCGVSPLPAPRKKPTAGIDADLPELSPTQTNPFLFDDQATEDDKHFDNSGHFDNDTPTPFKEDIDHSVDEKDYLHSKDNFEDIEESVLRDDNHAFAGLEHQTRQHHDNEEPITNPSPTQDYKTPSNNDLRNSERSNVTEDLAEDEEKNQARKPKVTFSESVVPDETRDEHESVAPAPTSATVRNDKGKLLKYESLDLEIDNSNPFFDDVYGEYNRRVYVSSRIWNIGSPKSGKIESQKPEAIPEDEDGDDSQRARAELGSSETAEKVSAPGENHQDSTPLIEDNEENKEENKDVEDDQEGNIHPDKTSDANGSAEQSQEGREDGQDEKREDVEAEGHKHEEDSEVIVKEVIQATHLAPPLNPEDADTDRSDGVSLETSSPGAENDSQILQQPAAQTEDARVVKSEASPLIDKDEDTPVKRGKRPVDSRLRDQNPGFACCNIL